MKKEFYPQKGQALKIIFNSRLELEGEGRIITTKAAKHTIEGFRNSSHQERQ